jgi:protein arginine kinase activator
MVCDVCGKNQATVHLTEIIDEQMNELHLCEECARQKSVKMEQQFGLADLLAGLSDFQKPSEEKEIISLKCPECGLMYKDFKKLGRMGCGECYSTFRKYLAPLLKKIHGSNTHFGKSPIKVPKAAKEKNNLQDLRFMLQKAIQREAYEEAAQIRDQIKKFQEKQTKDTSE